MDVLILMWDFHSVCFCFPLLTRTLHLFGVLETGSHCVFQACLEPMILLSLSGL